MTEFAPMRRWSATWPPAAEHDPVADHRRSRRSPTWPQIRQVRPTADVVAELDEVVDLGAVADRGVGDGAAVDAGVGADLDVVADHHRAERVDADVVLLLRAR